MIDPRVVRSERVVESPRGGGGGAGRCRGRVRLDSGSRRRGSRDRSRRGGLLQKGNKSKTYLSYAVLSPSGQCSLSCSGSLVISLSLSRSLSLFPCVRVWSGPCVIGAESPALQERGLAAEERASRGQVRRRARGAPWPVDIWRARK